ncbi:uncharacterized protein BCR38DRAFT_494240 [Pseudomassariella vexata]|uniref:Xylanolytic transcriptional activator regulatory domain-containing protein n=1 Tax=Pseudomassariella vexata TaxID=1141098 RepID=A0A1Y2EKX5_9PEZI|nr:uncharacterized protein BCR38DRAFT_494240 [Pseudomassariella vexata]ORY72187.1 hypothetical protein BCR38DRAFT_494240 [Pseudomassariella vexata]
MVQQCDRQYPCNHCSKRRQMERCIYHSHPDTRHLLKSPRSLDIDDSALPAEFVDSSFVLSTKSGVSPPGLGGQDLSPLAARYGYIESSTSNSLALIRKFGGNDYAPQNTCSQPLTGEDSEEVKSLIASMPRRHILDLLLQVFVSEISWIDQLIYPPWFLRQYRDLWEKGPTLCVADVEFLVLMLTVCSYATQFLPSPYYTLDRIDGISLSHIDNMCAEMAVCLSRITFRLDERGSWIRVQHVVFHALKCQMVGDMAMCLAALGSAVNTAQNDGMHRDEIPPIPHMDYLQKEMRHRTYCYLYVWDSHLARLLDHVPLLPVAAAQRKWIHMRLFYAQVDEHSSGGDAEAETDASDNYTERLLQARLENFWRNSEAAQAAEYNMMAADDRYYQFCDEFLAKLPASFRLQPDKTWDKRHPKLPLLRQMLHIAIYHSLCWSFRPLLWTLQDTDRLPKFKQVLLYSQKRAMAVAALHVLDAVGTLHRFLGGSHSRIIGLIIPTFEAAALLVCLCLDVEFPEEYGGEPGPGKINRIDPLRTSLIEAVQNALRRLRMLADVSSVAEVGAQSLEGLVAKIVTMTSTVSTTSEEETLTGNQERNVRPPSHHEMTPIAEIQAANWSLFVEPTAGLCHGISSAK